MKLNYDIYPVEKISHDKQMPHANVKRQSKISNVKVETAIILFVSLKKIKK